MAHQSSEQGVSDPAKAGPLRYLDIGEIYTDTDDDGAGNPTLIATLSGDLSEPSTHAIGALFAAAPDLLDAARKALALIEDMSRFVGQMSLQDYSLFNEAPLALRRALSKAGEGAE